MTMTAVEKEKAMVRWRQEYAIDVIKKLGYEIHFIRDNYYRIVSRPEDKKAKRWTLGFLRLPWNPVTS